MVVIKHNTYSQRQKKGSHNQDQPGLKSTPQPPIWISERKVYNDTIASSSSPDWLKIKKVVRYFGICRNLFNKIKDYHLNRRQSHAPF